MNNLSIDSARSSDGMRAPILLPKVSCAHAAEKDLKRFALYAVDCRRRALKPYVTDVVLAAKICEDYH